MSEKGTHVFHTAIMIVTLFVGMTTQLTPQQESALTFLIILLLAAGGLVFLLVIVVLLNKIKQS